MIAGIAFAVYFGLFGHDVIALLFERGRFGVNDSTRAGSILVAFALSTVASAAVALFVTLLYGLDSFVGILYREIAVLTVYLVAAPLLRAADGVVGLAWAFSAAQSVGAVLAGVLVFRRLAIGRRGLAVDGLAPLAVPVGALALGLLLARISLDRVAGDPSLRAAVGAGTVAVVGGAILARSPLPEARRVRRVARRRD